MVVATSAVRARDADRARADRGPGLRVRDRGAAAGGVAAAHEGRARAARHGGVRASGRSTTTSRVAGFDVLTNGERSNAGVSWVLLKDWYERTGAATVRGRRGRRGVRRRREDQGRVDLRGRAAADRRHVERRAASRVRPVAQAATTPRARAGVRRSSSRRPRSARSSRASARRISANVPQMRIDLDREKAMTARRAAWLTCSTRCRARSVRCT